VKATLGVLALAFGGGACVVGITSLLLGLQRKNDALLAVGRKCVAVLLVSALAAVGIMEWALVSHDFTIRYVAENNARSTPLLFTITGLWSALAGSILLWVLILSGYIGVTVRHFRKRASEPLVIWATIVMLGVALFFFLLVLGPANPPRCRWSAPRWAWPKPTPSESPANGVSPTDALPRVRGLHSAVCVCYVLTDYWERR
jgi:cytochrome c-type biogenesis protein CcmF